MLLPQVVREVVGKSGQNLIGPWLVGWFDQHHLVTTGLELLLILLPPSYLLLTPFAQVPPALLTSEHQLLYVQDSL